VKTPMIIAKRFAVTGRIFLYVYELASCHTPKVGQRAC